MPAIASRLEMEIELMERHVEMLKAILENQPIGIIRLSEILDYPQHKVRYSLRLLEQDGLIEPTPEGAVTTKKVFPFLRKLQKAMRSMEETIKSLEGMVEEVEKEVKEYL
ncbi:MAG: hypothetical protein J7L61_00800 [Thermoplasmata archaeon]|nr:hypothetical protein [Thermoplasmata archaeon]